MKKIEISKTLNFTKGSIEVNYKGIDLRDSIDLEKVELLLEDFINNQKYDDMLVNVTKIRTILSGCLEKSLMVFYQNENGSEFVKYDHDNDEYYNLLLYEKSLKDPHNEQDNRYTIKYEPTSGITLDYHYCQFGPDYPRIGLSEIEKIAKQIYYLEYAKAIELDENEKTLIAIYKLFYDENPDFRRTDINIRVQAMVTILAKFGVSLGVDYRCNSSLEEIIRKLYPLGEISNIEYTIDLDDKTKKLVSIVGEAVREACFKIIHRNETLIAISEVVNAKGYWRYFNSNVAKLSEITKRTLAETEENIKLVRSIKDKIDSQM